MLELIDFSLLNIFRLGDSEFTCCLIRLCEIFQVFPSSRMADGTEKTVADEIVVTKYKTAGEIVNSKLMWGGWKVFVATRRLVAEKTVTMAICKTWG